MRSKSSCRHGNKGMEGERPKVREEPQLSGAYIRSLVKQLSSSRPKENPKSPEELTGELAKPSDTLREAQQQHQHQPQPQPKKQVRRRLHTSRPYQERLLNMAEARREIVTALKFHRAAMKQAHEQQQEAQPTPTPPPQPSPPTLDYSHQEIMDSIRNPRIYPPNSTLPNYFHSSTLSPFTYPSPYSWAYPPIAPLPICDNLNLPLPNQPLGLNLNFQGFNNIDTPLNSNNNNNKPLSQPSLSPPSSSSSSSYPYFSPSPPTMSGLEVPSILNGPLGASESVPDPAALALHPVMDDDEMAEIRSIVEQHDIEWNDKMNVITSAWWCKFLKSMETVPEEKGGEGFPVFNEIMDMPAWMSNGTVGDANESCLLEQHLDDLHTEDYLQDVSLPCMDIGEIGEMDGEWLS